jgi:hypothetical protein
MDFDEREGIAFPNFRRQAVKARGSTQIIPCFE